MELTGLPLASNNVSAPAPSVLSVSDGARLAIGADQCEAGASVGRHIHPDASAMLVTKAQRGSAVSSRR